MVLTTARNFKVATTLEEMAIQSLKMAADGVVANLATANGLSLEQLMPGDGVAHVGVTVQGSDEAIEKLSRVLKRAGYVGFKIMSDEAVQLKQRDTGNIETVTIFQQNNGLLN